MMPSRTCRRSFGPILLSILSSITVPVIANAGPTVSFVTPSTIPQGSSSQAVTITGTGFTTSSYHQFSVSGGSAWAWATTAPTFNSSTSLTIFANNTVAQTILFRVCASNGSSVCSGNVSVTVGSTGLVLSESPPSGPQLTTTFVTQGNGFTPNTSIQRFVTPPNGNLTIAATVSNASGAFSFSYTTSCNDPSGNYQVYAYDPVIKLSSNTITRTVTSSPNCASTGVPTLSSNPTTGDQLNGRFSITGGGYNPNGAVQLSISPALNGSIFLGQTTASSTGLIYFVWTTDCSIPAANYSITARDVTKNQTAQPLLLAVASNNSCSTPGPKITQLSPNPMPGSTQPQYLTILGSTFQPGLKVRLQKSGIPEQDFLPELVWSNQIRVAVTVGTVAATWSVQIVNSDNNVSQAAALLVSGVAAPVVTAITNKPAITKGLMFVTRATNLTPGGGMEIFVRLPDGLTLQRISNANDVADSSGNFTCSFDTGKLNTFGSHQIFYRDTVSNQQSNEIPVTINPVQPGPSTNVNQGFSADPIDTATGNYTYEHTDLTIAGKGMPFTFARHYEAQNSVSGPLGNGWTHSFYGTLASNPVDNSITIHLGDGRTVVFDLQGGVYKPRYENVYDSLTSPSAGVYVMTTKRQMKYTFTQGKLSSIADRNANTFQLAYSGANLTTITDTAGRSITLVYDPSQRLITLTDPASRALGYGYDATGNLTSFTDARGKLFTYTYDGVSRMLTGVDPEGNTFVTNTYDSLGRVTTQKDGGANLWGYAYSPETGTTTITDPNQKTSLHIHDAGLKLLTQQDSFGKTTSFTYDVNNNRNQVTDRNGRITKLVYEQSGNALQTTDALGNISTATYNAFNDPLTRVDPLGNTTTFTYDGKSNLISLKDPLNNSTSFVYNASGQMTSSTDAEGRTTLYTYDASGNLTQVGDPLGNTTKYTYDIVGRRLTMVDASNFTTSNVYDNNDNLTKVTDPLNGVVEYTFDGNNNRLTMKDARLNTTTYTYDSNYKLATTKDALNGTVTTSYDKLRNPASGTDQRGGVSTMTYNSESRMTQSKDAVNNITSYGYDSAGNRTSMTDPLSKTTTLAYDALNRLTSTTDSLGAVTKTAYDAAGRVTSRTDAANNITSYTYDAAGRLTKTTDAANGTVTYSYDKVGNRTAVTDPRGKTTTFTYDALNRGKTITDPLANVTTNTYDAVGNLTKVVDGNGNTRNYAYDGNRRMTGTTFSIGSAVSYTYDANGNRTKMVDGQGTSTFAFDVLNRLTNYTHPLGAQMQFTYDAASNRTAVQYAAGKVARYAFDAANRMSTVTDWANAVTTYGYEAAGRVSSTGFPNGVSGAFVYDAVGRTTSIQYAKAGTSLYSEAVTWSLSGNPLTTDISGLSGSVIPSEATAYTYDNANRLATVPFGPVSSDKNGNVSVMPGFGPPTVFNYDLNNRTTAISGSATTAQMKYFGDGKLAEMTTSTGTARYLQDPGAAGNRILAELDASGNIQRAYLHGLGMISVIDGASTYYYLHNLQGSTVGIADGSGALVANYRYDPFGRTIQSTGSLTYPFRFLGRYSVPSISEYSVTSFRLYDSRSGRFTGPDPAHWSLNPGLSSYLYADQSPLRLIDANGLWASDVNDVFRSVLTDVGKQAVNSAAMAAYSLALSATTVAKGGLEAYDFVTFHKVPPLNALIRVTEGAQSMSATRLLEYTAASQHLTISPQDLRADAKTLTTIVDLSSAVAGIIKLPGHVHEILELQRAIKVKSWLGQSTTWPAIKQLRLALESIHTSFGGLGK